MRLLCARREKMLCNRYMARRTQHERKKPFGGGERKNASPGTTPTEKVKICFLEGNARQEGSRGIQHLTRAPLAKLSKIPPACNYARLSINLRAGRCIFFLFSPRDFYKWFLCVRTGGSLIFLPCAAFKYAWPSGAQIELSAAGREWEIFIIYKHPRKAAAVEWKFKRRREGCRIIILSFNILCMFTRVHTPLMPVCAKW